MEASRVSVEFRDFGGGITDDFVDCEDSQYATADNLLLDDQKKLITSPGSSLYDSSNARADTQRVGYLHNFYNDTDLFAFYGQRSFYYSSGWTELLGPTSNKAFPVAGIDTKFSTAEWKRHIFVATSSGNLPTAIYPSSSGYTLRTMGLPRMDESVKHYDEATTLSLAIALANQIRSKMIAHMNYTASLYHASVDSRSINLIGSEATDLTSLLTLVGTLQKAHTEHQKDALAGSPVYHSVSIPSAYQPRYVYTYYLTSLEIPETLVDACESLNDLKLKWNEHDAEAPGEFDDSAIYGFHQYIGVPGLGGNLFQISLDYINEDLLLAGPYIVKDIDYVITLVTRLNSVLRTHVEDATRHSNAFTGLITLSADPTTLRELIDYINSMVRIYSIHQEDRISYNSATVTVAHSSAPNTAYRLSGYGTGSPKQGYYPCLLADDATMTEIVTLLADFQSKFALHYNSGAFHSTSLGVDGYTSTELEEGSFNYAMHYFYSYYIDGTLFEIDGPITYLSLENTIIPSIQSQEVLGLPELSNGSQLNYDTANVKIKLYRTLKDQTTYYLVTTLDNGTLSFVDSIDDTTLATKETLYTTGGVYESTPPPQCKYLHSIADITYYANIVDTGQPLPQTIRQARPGAPESSPASFTVDILEPCTGISSFRQIPIAFSEYNVYRIEGLTDAQGRGSLRAVAISDKGGNIAPSTVVQTTEGVYFAGIDGIYRADGYKVENMTKELKQTYLSLFNGSAQRQKAYAAYDRQQQRIWFGVASDNSENDKYIVMDLNWGVLGDHAITTQSGSYLAPTASCFYRNELIRGDRLGYIFRHNFSLTNHPKVDEATSPTLWGTTPIVWDHVTRAVDLGSIFNRKYATDFSIKARNVGNATIQVKSIDNLGERIKDFTLIRYRGTCIWGDPSIVWGASTMVWGLRGEILEKRKFPSNSLRFTQKQLRLTSGYGVIQNSDTYGNCTVTSGTLTAALAGPTYLWNPDLVDQYIYFSVDSYVTAHKITAVSSDRLTLTLETSPASGAYSWVVKGYAKDEKLSLLSFQFTASMAGPSISDAQNELGANA